MGLILAPANPTLESLKRSPLQVPEQREEDERGSDESTGASDRRGRCQDSRARPQLGRPHVPRNPQPQTRIPNSETRHPKSETRNQKTKKTENRKPDTWSTKSESAPALTLLAPPKSCQSTELSQRCPSLKRVLIPGRKQHGRDAALPCQHSIRKRGLEETA